MTFWPTITRLSLSLILVLGVLSWSEPQAQLVADGVTNFIDAMNGDLSAIT